MRYPSPGDTGAAPAGTDPCATPCPAGSAHLAQLPFELGDLVAQAGGLLEAEVLRRVVHLVLQGLDELADVVGRHTFQVEHGRPLRGPPTAAPAATAGTHLVLFSFTGAHHLEDVDDLLADRLRVDAVSGVELELHLAAAVGLGDRAPHRVRHLAGVHH